MLIVYLDLDSMRPDRMGCYGYPRPTTPNIDRMAQQGARFANAYCSDSPCLPSRAALFSGRFGIRNGVVTHWGPGSEFRFPGHGGHWYDASAPMLARYLRDHGCRTVGFSSFPERHQAFWFTCGWSEMHNFTSKGGGETADEVNAAVIPWLRRNLPQDNLFLHINYWDPHREYRVEQSWIDLFQDEPLPDWPDERAIAEHRTSYGPYTASMLYPHGDGVNPVRTMPGELRNMADWRRLCDALDGRIRFMDHCIGQLFDVLDERGALHDACIIIGSDHGEQMGEMAVYSDHVCAAEAVHHLPLIVRWPGVTAPDSTIHGLCYHPDLAPTLCDMLGIPVPEGWDGQSLLPALRGRPWRGRDHLVWGHGLYTCQRAVRTDRWLYTRTMHPGLYPFEPEMLHDMRDDAHQTRDLAGANPQQVARMRKLLEAFENHHCQPGDGWPDPMQLVVDSGPFKYVPLEHWVQRLRREGRESDAARLLRRAGR